MPAATKIWRRTYSDRMIHLAHTYLQGVIDCLPSVNTFDDRVECEFGLGSLESCDHARSIVNSDTLCAVQNSAVKD